MDHQAQQFLVQPDPQRLRRGARDLGADVDVAERGARLRQVEGDDVGRRRLTQVRFVERRDGGRLDEGDRDLASADPFGFRDRLDRPGHVLTAHGLCVFDLIDVDDELGSAHDASRVAVSLPAVSWVGSG